MQIFLLCPSVAMLLQNLELNNNNLNLIDPTLGKQLCEEQICCNRPSLRVTRYVVSLGIEHMRSACKADMLTATLCDKKLSLTFLSTLQMYPLEESLKWPPGLTLNTPELDYCSCCSSATNPASALLGENLFTDSPPLPYFPSISLLLTQQITQITNRCLISISGLSWNYS